MKALSVKQPWAWAIIHAGKDIEKRTWRTDYRGPLLIHAGKFHVDREVPGGRRRICGKCREAARKNRRRA